MVWAVFSTEMRRHSKYDHVIKWHSDSNSVELLISVLTIRSGLAISCHGLIEE